jgi:hypothetical protein
MTGIFSTPAGSGRCPLRDRDRRGGAGRLGPGGLEALVGVRPLVLIHDAARPLCRPAVIDGVLDALGPIPARRPRWR